ncbi:MAG: glycosyltransferase [Acidobacteriota bacterium]
MEAQRSSEGASALKISVIVPLYRSGSTLARCLRALAQQTRRDFEVLLVDSSPDLACEVIVQAAQAELPQLVYLRSAQRLLPQPARNLGAARARGDYLVFSDPDCYARPDWLERLVAAHEDTRQPVVGGLACHGRRPFDRAVHLCKFSKWLPAGKAREVDMGPTANLICSRASFETLGGFQGDPMVGDALFSWRLRAAGATLVFAPDAVVEHHHLDTWKSFLTERFRRGQDFAALRLAWLGARRPTSFGYLVVSALPIRLATNLFHVARHAARAGATMEFVRGLPVIAVGHAASLAGESVGYARALRRRSIATASAPESEVTAAPVVR